jgi:hypothetical protein
MGGRQGYTGYVQPTVENHPSIDVRGLAKANMLRPGTRLKVTWGNPESSFIVEVASRLHGIARGVVWSDKLLDECTTGFSELEGLGRR